MSEQTLKVFVGTDGGVEEPAEKALAYSFQKNSSIPVEIEFMDEKRGNPFWHGWNKNRWYTPFTCYRWGIPEFCNFEGVINIGKPFGPFDVKRTKQEKTKILEDAGHQLMCRIAALLPTIYHGAFLDDTAISAYKIENGLVPKEIKQRPPKK